jgi:hypothetical protein
MYRRLLIAALWLLSPIASAQAADEREITPDHRMRAAYCEPGKGCHSCLLPHSYRSVALALQRPEIQPGDILTLVPEGLEWKRTLRRESSTWALSIAFGGPGRDLLADCYERPPLPGAIQPRNGLWHVNNSDFTAERCPGDAEAMKAKLMADDTVRLSFRAPFQGALVPEMPPMIQTGPNQFSQDLRTESGWQWTGMVVISPDEITARQVIMVEVPATGEVCTVGYKTTLERVDD